MPPRKVTKINFNTGSGKGLFVKDLFQKMHSITGQIKQRKQMAHDKKSSAQMFFKFSKLRVQNSDVPMNSADVMQDIPPESPFFEP